MLNLRKGLIALALLLAPSMAFAQTATQQSATHLDTSGLTATNVTSATTTTITPPAGQSVYFSGLDITNCAGASAVTAAAVTSITTTNLNGLAYTLGSGTTAGACQPTINPSFPPGGIKSASPGTAVTFVMPTFATNQTIRLNVYYWFAP